MSKEITNGTIPVDMLHAIFRTSKRTIQNYILEIERHNRYKTMRSDTALQLSILDDRSGLINLYEACLQQDAHLRGCLETLFSQIVGERYMLAYPVEGGIYKKDFEESQKIQGIQFGKLIKGIAEAKLFGYTGFELNPEVDPVTGRLKEINVIERRNILPDQEIILERQGDVSKYWDISRFPYQDNYILINCEDIGLFAATTPLVLAKKFTWANFINFAHTYAVPIIHGKTNDDSNDAKNKLARQIADAASRRVLVTPPDDSIEIKAITTSNSERIYTTLVEMANKEVSNLILGSESLAGETQSYVGSTSAHQEIYRDRIEVYRSFIEDVMNEQVLPRLKQMGFITKSNLEFKYANRAEMSPDNKIKLYDVMIQSYEVSPEEIDRAFGIQVGDQMNFAKAKSEVAKNKAMADAMSNKDGMAWGNQYVNDGSTGAGSAGSRTEKADAGEGKTTQTEE